VEKQKCPIMEQGEYIVSIIIKGLEIVGCVADCPYRNRTRSKLIFEGDNEMYVCKTRGLVNRIKEQSGAVH